MRATVFFCILIWGTTHSFGAPTTWNMPPQNIHFVGRKKILQEITALLKKRSICVLTGGPGFGKTQIAKQFAFLHYESYKVIWWFRADQPLSKPFEQFAEALNTLLDSSERIPIQRLSTERLTDEVKNLLRRTPFKGLLIFDNVKDFEAIRPYLPAFRPGLDVLLTTRTRNTAHLMIDIDKFLRKESIVFIRQLFPQLNEVDLMKIVHYFFDHPLALATAASFLLSHPSVSVTQYLTSHDLQRHEAPVGLFIDQHEHNLDTSLRITLKMLTRENLEACQTLKFLTFLHHRNIPLSYLRSFLKRNRSQKTADHVVSTLYAQSFLVVHKNDNSPKVRLSMHELIHNLIHRQIPEDEKRKLLEKAILVIFEPFDGRSDLVIPRIIKTPEYLVHAQELSKIAQEMNYHSVPLLALRVRMLDFFMSGLRDCEQAKRVITDIQSDQKKLGVYKGDFLELGLEPEFLSPFLQALLALNLGFFDAAYTLDYDKATAHAQKALALFEQIPDTTEEQLRIISNLAQYYFSRGQLKAGAELIEKGKVLLKKSRSDIYNTLFIYAWSMLLLDQGKYKEVVHLIDQHMGLLKNAELLTIEIAALQQKAEALAKMGETSACANTLAIADKAAVDFFGKRDSNMRGNLMVIQALNNLNPPQEIKKSMESIQQALALYSRVFHGEKKHRMQGFAYFVLGRRYEKADDSQSAKDAYQKSEAVYDAVLKEKAIDDVSRLYTTLAILGLKSNDEDLARVYMGKQMEIFGLNHPRTVQIVRYALRNKLKIPYPNSL